MIASRTLRYLRTTHGQLAVLGVVYGGAVLVALVAVVFFGDWFEASVYEKFKTSASDRLRKLADDVAAGREQDTAVRDLSEAEVLQVYALWIDESDIDPRRKLAVAMCRFHSERLLGNIRRTLVVGNSKQRLKSLEFLGTMSDQRDIVSARQLCEFALQRSQRCGEQDVSESASALLRRFQQLP